MAYQCSPPGSRVTVLSPCRYTASHQQGAANTRAHALAPPLHRSHCTHSMFAMGPTSLLINHTYSLSRTELIMHASAYQ